MNGEIVLAQVASLSDPWEGSVERRYGTLANVAALLYETMESINWVGFYLRPKDERRLLLGPFQGKVACMEIPFEKGVCGAAASLDRTQMIADVHAIGFHIACDSASRSEVVVPLHDGGGRVVGVLDVDSPHVGRFSEEDRLFLERVASLVERRSWT